MRIHSFHIPVMGIAFTVDTPLKVAPLGIDSAISLVDDILLEKLRKMYSEKFGMPYSEIHDKIRDFRAKRITAYLNLIQELAQNKFERLKDLAQGPSKELKEYGALLPKGSPLEQKLAELIRIPGNRAALREFLDKNLKMGRIEVNIMTKLDRENHVGGVPLPPKYNDAHAALRGFAQSGLDASLIFSAGMNPRLYGHMEEFGDFYPDALGRIKKKIVLKVSDFRSALIQGKFLAKKGLWVSEFRIESGLNCGGHAFATEGHLMGPILAQFRDRRDALVQELHGLLSQALENKGKPLPPAPLPLRITAQGGVGTAGEHRFLLEHYGLDSVGWGTPFLLVPEATTVDDGTLDQLVKAREEDLYLSDISPLGVPFNSLRGNTKDLEKLINIQKNRPGSSCPKKYVALNKEFSDKGICTASREYQHLKIKELQAQGLSREAHDRAYAKIVEKACACVGLGTSALLKYGLETRREGEGVSVCPGPNMAYFTKIASLKEMVGHIYGESNLLERDDRPNLFIKELDIYLEHLSKKMETALGEDGPKPWDGLMGFAKNLGEGIAYYRKLFQDHARAFLDQGSRLHGELSRAEGRLGRMIQEITEQRALCRVRS